jgi:polysaccharide export outer membrane protein
MLFRQGEAGQRQVATFDVEKIRSGQEPDPPIRGDDLIVVQRDSTRAAFTDSLFRDVINVFNPLTYIPR